MHKQTIEQVGDNIYVNISISPSFLNPGTLEVPAEYRVTKTIPILHKCDDYYLSVIRFDVPLNNVPLFIMPIVPNQGNPNLTTMFIGITTGGIDYGENIIFVSSSGEPAPIQNKPTQVITSYYFVYEYQNLINAINAALAKSFISSGLPGNCPYFYLDANTKEINLVVDRNTFSPEATPAVPNPVPLATIYMNIILQRYLSAFEVNYVVPQGLVFNPTGKDYVFNLIRFGFDTTIPPYTPAALQKQITQEYSVLNIWSSLRKIILVSNSIPIISEYTPTNNSGISSTLPIISDFIPQIELPGQTRSIAYYNPQGQYRLIDLKSSGELNSIDIKIYWQDLNLNIYPLYISQDQQANIKLGFFKKELYKSNKLTRY